MANIQVPTLGESITEGKIVKLLKSTGEYIKKDEVFAELETDKVTIEIPANHSGVIDNISCKIGDTVLVGAILCSIDESKQSAPKVEKVEPTKAAESTKIEPAAVNLAQMESAQVKMAPSAKVLLENSPQYNIDLSKINPTGKKNYIIKTDIQDAIKETITSSKEQQQQPISVHQKEEGKEIEIVKMSKLRQTIATRLKKSQEVNATLSTFNEVDMTNLIALRSKFKDKIEKKYQVKLGFMSFFTKAVVAALKEFAIINASIDGDSIIYKKYYNVGIAVGTENGLVVPTLRQADKKSLVEIEEEIVAFAKKAKDGKLTMFDLSDGTFTITNGGVYGSLLSTPIINPPQSAILGLHNIQKRAVVIGDEIKIRDMMYIALSYDHRIIDGKEAVTFLRKIKEIIEDPVELMLIK